MFCFPKQTPKKMAPIRSSKAQTSKKTNSLVGLIREKRRIRSFANIYRQMMRGKSVNFNLHPGGIGAEFPALSSKNDLGIMRGQDRKTKVEEWLQNDGLGREGQLEETYCKQDENLTGGAGEIDEKSVEEGGNEHYHSCNDSSD